MSDEKCPKCGSQRNTRSNTGKLIYECGSYFDDNCNPFAVNRLIEDDDCFRRQIAQREAQKKVMRDALNEIHKLGYEWTMNEPLEIVTAGGIAHAAPIGSIVQLADYALQESKKNLL